MNPKKVPVYIKIALDVAGRIYSGEYIQGEKIKGRSTLAGEYNTSPETIRKAMSLLRDMDVVQVQHGSGNYVKSKQNAYSFIERFKSKETLDDLKKELKQLIIEKKQLDEKMNEIVEKIVDYSERFKGTNLINPIEVKMPVNSHLIGLSIGDSNFWQNTGATIIGIKRKEYLMLSPGPYEQIEADDVLMLICDVSIIDRVYHFINE